MKCDSMVGKIAGLLVMIGAINWGLVGAFDFNLVHALLGSVAIAERIVYILVGLSGLMALCSCAKSGGSCQG